MSHIFDPSNYFPTSFIKTPSLLHIEKIFNTRIINHLSVGLLRKMKKIYILFLEKKISTN